MANEQSPIGRRFLVAVILMYIIVCFINSEAALKSLHVSYGLLMKIVPILMMVFVIMVILNVLVTPAFIAKHLGSEAGPKKWVIAVAGGILSTGPIYMWYPLLKDLKSKGISNGLIATFLYNRAIKPFLLPMMVYYFGWAYTVVLTVVMVIASLTQGVLIERMRQI